MAYAKNVWNQLKNLTADGIISALLADGWEKDPSSKGAIIGYLKRGSSIQRVTIHYHPQKTYGPKLLKDLLNDIGWDEQELRRLRLIK
jgi:predicted RNA binding protein YcfA (HicA-like mRNA interferase family)